MATKAKSGFRGILAVAALLAAGYLIVSVKGTSLKTRVEVDEVIVLSVLFDPPQRTKTVTIYASIEGGTPIRAHPNNSPWSQAVTIRKGAQVGVHALQEDPGPLECFIHRNGVQIAHQKVETPGSVHCWMNRK